MSEEQTKKQVDRIKYLISKLPDITIPAAISAMARFGIMFVSFLQRNRLAGRPGLIRRSGRLAGSLKHGMFGGKNAPVLRVWTAVKYSRLQELGSAGLPGGVVRPTKGKYLAIPVGPAKTKSGVSKFPSPRAVAGLKFMPSRKKGDTGLLFMPKAKGSKSKGGIVVWFVLKKQVKIEPRFGFKDSFMAQSKNVLPMIADGVEEAYGKRFQRVR